MRYLNAAQHVGLEELLVGEGVVDQRAVVHDGVDAARQSLPLVVAQAQLRLRQVACRSSSCTAPSCGSYLIKTRLAP